MALAATGPATSTPPRLVGSVRRTSSIAMDFPPGVPLRLAGRARDVRTGADGRVTVLSEATLRAHLDRRRELLTLATTPGIDADELLGRHVGSGFRGRTTDVLGPGDGSPLRLLLDDLPVAALISGYAQLRAAARVGKAYTMTPPAQRERMADLCSGWRAGGVMLTSVEAGDGVPAQDCPPAPDIAGGDPWSWHAVPALPPGAMCRRRRLDVVPQADGALVDAMFRDSYAEPDGTEVVLHEYDLRATVSGDPLAFTEIAATPRVLPFPECPLAADSAARLVDVPVADARELVRRDFTGTTTCTHLNDLLRALTDVAVLTSAVR